ncbi:unnamed protein product [Prorocentrum cordatum]|uniref:Uncharacterized protein n=1 Tax=Prorocentrum cordatum TaxID=2364126 RepID=A0ABN9RXU7_9DINO|nr:unnamed protein product [Polarella glacialis]
MAVPGINTGLPIVYDSSCPGLCCFEDQPCRYNNTGCYSAALAQQKVRTTPTNDAECKAVKGINTGLPIVYDSSCPGLCCFEDQPCRYNNTGCYSAALAQQKVQQHGLLLRSPGAAEGEDDAHERRRVQGREGHQHGPAHRLRLHCPGLCCFEDQPCRYNNTGCYSAALAQQEVRTTPTNDAECKAVKGINTGLPIVYDSSCPGLCCFEDQPCRYNNTGCYSAALAQQNVRTTPTNDAECKAVKDINTGLPIVYDSSCPGLCCFEDQPCRYNNTGCYSAALAQHKGEDDAHERRRVQGREGHQHGPAHRLRLQLPRPVLLRGPAVQVQQHGLLLRALAQQKVRTTPTNDAECKAVKGINTGLPIVYDSSCPGLCWAAKICCRTRSYNE